MLENKNYTDMLKDKNNENKCSSKEHFSNNTHLGINASRSLDASILKNDIGNLDIKIIKSRYILYNKQTNRELSSSIRISVMSQMQTKHPFLSGLGSILNIPGNYFSFDNILSRRNDADAMYSDWRNVGFYMYDSLAKFKFSK